MAEAMCGSEHHFGSRYDMIDVSRPNCKGGRCPLQCRSRKQWVLVNTQGGRALARAWDARTGKCIGLGVVAMISGDAIVNFAELKQNHLLASLPDDVWNRWSPLLEMVDMPLGYVLYESGVALTFVYFPLTSIVSLLYVMENGASAEIAVVGNEGIVGVSLFMGGESTPSRAVVQSAGLGCRLEAQVMKAEFNRAGPVLHLLLRYTQALITQMAQTAVCNRHHSVDQQLCRWLLLSLDRLKGDELVMTQELIANMLGVRREGVTEGALKLQKADLIRYARGRITILDRAGLEKRTCECYEVVRREYERLLPPVTAT
jgi:CRP-like cAMP-binding protein